MLNPPPWRGPATARRCHDPVRLECLAASNLRRGAVVCLGCRLRATGCHPGGMVGANPWDEGSLHPAGADCGDAVIPSHRRKSATDRPKGCPGSRTYRQPGHLGSRRLCVDFNDLVGRGGGRGRNSRTVSSPVANRHRVQTIKKFNPD